MSLPFNYIRGIREEMELKLHFAARKKLGGKDYVLSKHGFGKNIDLGVKAGPVIYIDLEDEVKRECSQAMHRSLPIYTLKAF